MPAGPAVPAASLVGPIATRLFCPAAARWNMLRPPVLVVSLTLLAGCLGSADAPDAVEPASTEPEILVDADRPTESLGEVVTGPEVGPDLEATTAAPPRLVEGEWWRIRFAGAFYQQTIEVVRVVADVNEDGYIVGMPHDGWLKEAIAYHSPAFGDVNFDLSYDTHNERFEPVRFPLVEGATWETKFALSPMVATVESADEYTATISFKSPESEPSPEWTLMGALGVLPEDTGMLLTYDARMHEIVKMESFVGTWEVVAHGYDFEGWVTVPRGEHTAIDYGTFGPASAEHNPAPRKIDVNGGFNRLTMMHVIIPLAPGSYQIHDVTPDGTEFVTDTMKDLVIKFYESSEPNGRWTVQDVVGGAGVTYSMGIAYHQYDIRLPDGLRRTDHSHPVIR